MKTLTQISGYQLLNIIESIGLKDDKIELRHLGKARVNPGEFDGTIEYAINGDYNSLHSKQLGDQLPYYIVTYTKSNGEKGSIYAA